MQKHVHRALFVLVIGVMGLSMFAPMVALGNGVFDSATTLSTTSFQDASPPAEATPVEEDVTAPSSESTVSAESSPTIPWKSPIDYGVVVDNTASPLPADGLACRTAADNNAEVITRFAQGTTIEVTGEALWVGDVEFLPVNCVDQGGFVKADYVALQSEQVQDVPAKEPVVADEPVAEEPVADEPVAEEPVVDEPVADEPVADEQPQEAAPVAGDLIVTVVDQNGHAVAGACFDLYNADGWVASACDSNDAVPNNGNSGFFALAEGSYTLVATSGISADNQEAWVSAGETSYATVAVTTASAPVEDVPATDEPVVTEEPAAAEEDVAEEPVVTEVPVTEEATDVATEEPAATDEPVTDEATDAATEEPAADEATEEPAATEAPAEEAATEPALDVSGALGDATVTGTNGEGVRCRVAPDATSATITVLPEGATVFVLENPANGYLGVACGNQLGYVDVNFMWAGGAGDEIPSSASSVVVVGTGGSRLNCRSGAGSTYSIVTSVAQGTVLTTRGASSNGWAPVVCNGQNAFVSINFIEVSGSGTGTTTPTTITTSGTGTISGLGGDRLNCRSGAGSTYSIITTLAEGTVVTVRGAASNGWVPIVCGGMNGFVFSSYITLGSGTGTGNESPAPTPTPAPAPSSGYVKVSGTGGSRLNCRSAASSTGMIITSVAEGTTLQVRGATTNGWVPVVCASRNGYVSSSFVTSTTSPAPDPGSGTGTETPASTTGTAKVVNTGGTGVRCRVEPNGTIITTVAEGTTVGTRGASSNGWTPVVCASRNGYISSAYLSTGGTTTPDPTPTPTPATGLAVGDHAKLTANVNLRYSPGGTIVIVVPSGTVVKVTGGLSSGSYKVDWDGLGGYLVDDYLTKTSEALSERGGSGSEPDPAPAPGGTATGNAMVNFAMRYVGYPYVWATSGPSSFDCSGFTYWVTKNVTGANIGTGLWTQWAAGTPVSRSNLQPGDLVFFQNTYKAGLSHNGIYIGNNQFVHAENETTGVRVSDLNSTYYGSRWLGARRMT